MSEATRAHIIIIAIIAFLLGSRLTAGLFYCGDAGRLTGTAVDEPMTPDEARSAAELQRAIDELVRSAGQQAETGASTSALSTADLTRLTTEIGIEQGKVSMVQGDAKAFTDIIKKASQSLNEQ